MYTIVVLGTKIWHCRVEIATLHVQIQETAQRDAVRARFERLLMLRTPFCMAVLAFSALLPPASAAPAGILTNYVGGAVAPTSLARRIAHSAVAGTGAIRGTKLYAGYGIDVAESGSTDVLTAIELSAWSGSGRRGRFGGYSAALSAAFNGQTYGAVARLGLAAVETTVDHVARARVSARTYGPTFGLGATAALSANWIVRLDWDWVPVKYADAKWQGAHLITMGATYRF